MSHTVRVETRLKNEKVLEEVLTLLKEKGVVERWEKKNEVKLHQGTVKVKNGVAVYLKGWEYPVLVDLETGKVYYDNWNGRWGRQEYLEDLLNEYALEEVLLELSRKTGIPRSRLRKGAKIEKKNGKVAVELELEV